MHSITLTSVAAMRENLQAYHSFIVFMKIRLETNELMYEGLHCSFSSAFQNNGYFYNFKERETF